MVSWLARPRAPTTRVVRAPGGDATLRTGGLVANLSVQEQRTETSRKLLIDAALQIIGSEGLRGLTTTRIEAVSGASRGLVGYHFGSKQGLLEAVIQQAHRFVGNIPDLAVAERATGAEGTIQIVRGYLEQLGHEPLGHRVILILITESVAAQPQLREAIQALNAVLRDSVRQQLARGLADGSVRSGVDPAAESFVVASILRGIALQWLVDPAAIDLGQAQESAVAVIRRAYT